MTQPIARKAEEKDIAQIVRLGILFAKDSESVHTFSPSEEKIIAFVTTAVSSPEHVTLVFEVEGTVRGFITGVILAPYFSAEKLLQELAFFSTTKGGMCLLATFEDEARKLGIKKIVVGSKPAYCDLSPAYARRGYKLLEHQFLKIQECEVCH